MPKKNRILCLFDDYTQEVVQELADQDGEGFNAALRKIIREWARTGREVTTTTGNSMPGFVPGTTFTLYGEPNESN